MSEETFTYNKQTTRTVCRNCGHKYDDFYYADISGSCDDCKSTSGHLGFTNEPNSVDQVDAIMENIMQDENLSIAREAITEYFKKNTLFERGFIADLLQICTDCGQVFTEGITAHISLQSIQR